MFKYIEQIAAWGLQISALKIPYQDNNFTLHITRVLGKDPTSFFKDGTSITAPLYYVLKNGKVDRLEVYLLSKYPDKKDTTAHIMKQAREWLEKQVRQPETGDNEMPEPETPAVAPNVQADSEIQKGITQLISEIEGIKKAMPVTPEQRAIAKELQQLVAEYDPNKTFAQEYRWVPKLFDWLYFIVSPIIAIFGAGFFYAQVNNVWLLVVLVVMFLALELIFRRTIVRKCVAAFMRGRYVFGGITLVMALAISAWSVVAILHGTEQIRQMVQAENAIFASTPTQDRITTMSDSLSMWRTQQKSLDGKWGVSLHISKDLSKRIEAGEKELENMKLQLQQEKATGVATWRYLFLLLELIVMIALVLPVWYHVRCVLEAIDNN